MTTLDAKTLYQALVLDHGKSPRNEGVLEGATHEATLKNPLCGDRVTIQARVEDGVIRAAKFQARGCMIAKASASLLTETVIGRTLASCVSLVTALDGLVVGDAAAVDPALESLRGVSEFPARRVCATLSWHALRDSLATKPV